MEISYSMAQKTPYASTNAHGVNNIHVQINEYPDDTSRELSLQLRG